MSTRNLTINGNSHHLRRVGSTVTLFAFGAPSQPFQQQFNKDFGTVRAAKAFMNSPSF